jgi:uncharacterized membrane protein YqjE
MLKETISKFFKVDSLLSNLSGYVETRAELLKVEVKEDMARGLAQGVGYLFIAFIFALFITFLSIGVALVLGGSVGNVAGFSIVAAFYFLTGVILWFSREKIISKLENRFLFIFRRKK